MAITLDATEVPTKGTSVSTLDHSHTCSGANRLLIVGVVCNGASGITTTGVTYNGVAMTKIDNNAPQSNVDLSLWYLIAPATGTNTITASFSSSATVAYIFPASYNGAKQSGVPDSTNKNTAVSTSLSVSTTTIADNCWVVGAGFTGASAITASTGMTSRSERDDANGSVVLGDSNAAVTPAGSYSMTITNAADSEGLILASFAPSTASAVTTPIPTLLYMGVG